eukprot:1102559-Pelagomonas_calceolata.AAC.1
MKCLKECHSEGPRRAPAGPRGTPKTPRGEALYGARMWHLTGATYGRTGGGLCSRDSSCSHGAPCIKGLHLARLMVWDLEHTVSKCVVSSGNSGEK